MNCYATKSYSQTTLRRILLIAGNILDRKLKDLEPILGVGFQRNDFELVINTGSVTLKHHSRNRHPITLFKDVLNVARDHLHPANKSNINEAVVVALCFEFLPPHTKHALLRYFSKYPGFVAREEVQIRGGQQTRYPRFFLFLDKGSCGETKSFSMLWDKAQKKLGVTA